METKNRKAITRLAKEAENVKSQILVFGRAMSRIKIKIKIDLARFTTRYKQFNIKKEGEIKSRK